MKSLLRFLVTSLMLAALGLTARAQMAPAMRMGAPGSPALDFVTKDVNGKEVRLTDFKGKVVILDYWATWCGPCMQSLPHTQWMAKEYKDQGVVVLAVCTSDTRAKFEAWVKKNAAAKYPDITFTCELYEPESDKFDERSSNKLYHVQGIPTQFVIGRDGKIAGKVVGYDQGDARAESLLASCGIKVDPAAIAKGSEQLKAAADAEERREAEEIAARAHPKPAFRESLGKTKVGTTLPDVSIETADGKTVKLADATKDHVSILVFWSAGGAGLRVTGYFDGVAKRYADQGVSVFGIYMFAQPDQFHASVEKSKEFTSIQLVRDPAGGFPAMDKEASEMTPAERKEYGHKQMAVINASIMGQIMQANGGLLPVPSYIVLNRKGELVGWSAGYGPMTPESVGNLLLRADVKLTDADRPKNVFSHEDTKDPVPEARVQAIKMGGMAPDFTGFDIDGKPVKLSDYKGKVVILDFWATWCGPCIASMPHTQSVAKEYKDQGLVVLASCTSDSRANFEKWVKQHQADYPDMHFSHDAAERKPERASRHLYGVEGIPMQFIIDRDGKLVTTVIGYKKGEVILEGAIAKAGIHVAPDIVAKAAKDLADR